MPDLLHGWTHLELGAENYGLDGHTRVSQRKTALRKITDACNVEKHLSDLEEFVFTIYQDAGICFVPAEEKEEFMEKNVFYLKTVKWQAVPYIFPEGKVISKENGRVFFISAG